MLNRDGAVANSYDFDGFSQAEKQTELKRLYHQATLISHFELPTLDKIGIPKSGDILDVGCGPGFVSAEIGHHFPESRLIGIDNSHDMIEVANKVVSPQCTNIKFKNGDAYHTGLEDHAFDFIYNRAIYQHLSDPHAALKESIRVARKGAKICICDVDDAILIFHPEPPSMNAFKQLAAKSQEESGGNRFVGRRLPLLMQKAGLKNIRAWIESFSTLDVGFDTFFHITTTFKSQIIGTKEGHELLEKIKKEIREYESPPFGIVGVIFAVGEK